MVATTPSDPAAAVPATAVRRDATKLWWGALLTALAAVLFPRLNAVLHESQAFWQLDTEAAVGIPAIVAATVALFALLGRWACRGDDAGNRPATVGLTTGTLAVVGVVAFFVSAPIVLGGLTLTLGLEGLERSAFEGKRGGAVAALALGTIAVVSGAIIWLAA